MSMVMCGHGHVLLPFTINTTNMCFCTRRSNMLHMASGQEHYCKMSCKIVSTHVLSDICHVFDIVSLGALW